MRLSSLAALLPLILGAVVGGCRSAQPGVPSLDATSQAPVSPRVTFGPRAIDAALRAEWSKAGIAAAPAVDDLRFLRRAYLDVVGTVPPPAVVAEFMGESGPDKRNRLVDRLLASPAYAAYWATYWESTLVGWNTRDPFVDRGALREWLASEFAANTPWDKVVTGLLTATGQNSRGGKRLDAAPSPAPPPMAGASASQGAALEPDDSGLATPTNQPINGAVNWFLKYKDAPQDMAGTASRLFLGVQIQCAQCHDHKTEKWKQTDFQRFAACFARTRTEPIDTGKVMGLKRAMVVDIGRPLPRFAKNPDLAPIIQAEPAALDGTSMASSPAVRGTLAAWVTAKSNPWFAKAIVNRMWGHFMGRGFVDPVDDIRDSNPATMPDLFAMLSDDFAAHGDDLKMLIRTIMATEAYQLAPAAASPSGASPTDAGNAERLWSHFHVTPLGPNELLRSILDVTEVESVLQNRRANVERIRFQLYQRYAFLFDVDEDFEQTDFEGTVAQALSLLNGELVGAGTTRIPGGALDALLRQPGSDADKITALYVRTLTRAPAADELAYWVGYVNEPHAIDSVEDATAPPPQPPVRAPQGKKKGEKKGAPNKPAGPDPLARIEARDRQVRPDSRTQAYADLFWALLNSSEFIFNH